MEEEVHKDILSILGEIKKAVELKDIMLLKRISDQTIHNSSLYQDRNSVSVAVLSYSLSKLYERERYHLFKGWSGFEKMLKTAFDSMIDDLEKHNYPLFEEHREGLFKSIAKLDNRLRKHVQFVIHRARISKSSRLYEHGLSLGRTATLMGISQFELMDYIGSTWIADVKEGISTNAVERLKIARRVFK